MHDHQTLSLALATLSLMGPLTLMTGCAQHTTIEATEQQPPQPESEAPRGARDAPMDEHSDGLASRAHGRDTHDVQAQEESEVTDAPELEGLTGALVTDACVYQGYPYAIDILLSCGDEKFGAELRLHTFKRHAHPHGLIFNDQALSYRDQQLWFDAYTPKRCIDVDSEGKLMLSTAPEACTPFELLPQGEAYAIRGVESGLCLGLGQVACADHKGTGGYECGGIAHRYLPLTLDTCTSALTFRVEAQVEPCSNEYPESQCF